MQPNQGPRRGSNPNGANGAGQNVTSTVTVHVTAGTSQNGDSAAATRVADSLAHQEIPTPRPLAGRTSVAGAANDDILSGELQASLDALAQNTRKVEKHPGPDLRSMLDHFCQASVQYGHFVLAGRADRRDVASHRDTLVQCMTQRLASIPAYLRGQVGPVIEAFVNAMTTLMGEEDASRHEAVIAARAELASRTPPQVAAPGPDDLSEDEENYYEATRPMTYVDALELPLQSLARFHDWSPEWIRAALGPENLDEILRHLTLWSSIGNPFDGQDPEVIEKFITALTKLMGADAAADSDVIRKAHGQLEAIRRNEPGTSVRSTCDAATDKAARRAEVLRRPFTFASLSREARSTLMQELALDSTTLSEGFSRWLNFVRGRHPEPLRFTTTQCLHDFVATMDELLGPQEASRHDVVGHARAEISLRQARFAQLKADPIELLTLDKTLRDRLVKRLELPKDTLQRFFMDWVPESRSLELLTGPEIEAFIVAMEDLFGKDEAQRLPATAAMLAEVDARVGMQDTLRGHPLMRAAGEVNAKKRAAFIAGLDAEKEGFLRLVRKLVAVLPAPFRPVPLQEIGSFIRLMNILMGEEVARKDDAVREAHNEFTLRIVFLPQVLHGELNALLAALALNTRKVETHQGPDLRPMFEDFRDASIHYGTFALVRMAQWRGVADHRDTLLACMTQRIAEDPGCLRLQETPLIEDFVDAMTTLMGEEAASAHEAVIAARAVLLQRAANQATGGRDAPAVAPGPQRMTQEPGAWADIGERKAAPAEPASRPGFQVQDIDRAIRKANIQLSMIDFNLTRALQRNVGDAKVQTEITALRSKKDGLLAQIRALESQKQNVAGRELAPQ